MIEGLYTSVTGMSAFSNQLSVISDNVSNSETTSYKSNSVSFADMLNQSLTGTSGNSVGAGVEVQAITACWNQGSLSSTGTSTDLAINGSGFFILQNDEGVTYYTRNGGFEFDNAGTLVNSSGLAVQGYAIDESGNFGTLSDIVISYEPIPPSATSEMYTSVNLSSGLESGNTYSTTTSVYDSLGNEISLTITYTKSATENEWDWEASIPSTYGALTGDTSGTITFESDGSLSSGTDPVFTMSLTNGADDTQTITWDLYDESGTTNGYLTQYAGDSSINEQGQDGYASGNIYDVSITEDGVIVGAYTNGETQDLFQIALADFINYNGLKKTGSGLYQATADSGQAIVGIPGSGQFGSVTAESLEMSNVDMATQLANLITAQRAYQACARVFNVTSEVLETTVNLK
ncbi:MAG TPA: flagellar hook protein FlgE [Desulfobacterales bacterium]|nr:flagellar hook protein FlgE [Desulfobacterales bacterium]